MNSVVLTLCAVATWTLLSVASGLLGLATVSCLSAVLVALLLTRAAVLTLGPSMLLLAAVATVGLRRRG